MPQNIYLLALTAIPVILFFTAENAKKKGNRAKELFLVLANVFIMLLILKLTKTDPQYPPLLWYIYLLAAATGILKAISVQMLRQIEKDGE